MNLLLPTELLKHLCSSRQILFRFDSHVKNRAIRVAAQDVGMQCALATLTLAPQFACFRFAFLYFALFL